MVKQQFGPRRNSLGTVILFARVPKLGRGKRRLARDIGDLAAHRFYQRALERTVTLVAAEAGWRAMAAIDPPRLAACPGPVFRRGRARRIRCFPQSGRDLGQRMAAALAAAPPGPVVLIGADIQRVSAAALRRALLACRRADLVFGPAEDGGFWLIGLKRPPSRRLFGATTWSTATTLAQAMAAAPKAWRIACVDRLRDVDVAADLPIGRDRP